jgi:hypothetical protein
MLAHQRDVAGWPQASLPPRHWQRGLPGHVEEVAALRGGQGPQGQQSQPQQSQAVSTQQQVGRGYQFAVRGGAGPALV